MPRLAANLSMLWTELPLLDRFEWAARAGFAGEINFAFLFAHLDRIGYAGWIGCEYKPATTTDAGREHLASQSR